MRTKVIEARRIEMEIYFKKATAPISENDVLTHFKIGIKSLGHDLSALRKKGVDIVSRMKYYSLRGKFSRDLIVTMRSRQMNPKIKIPKKNARRIAIVEFFKSASKPIQEYDVVRQFGVSIYTLNYDLMYLKKIGIHIGRSMRHYSLFGDVNPDYASLIAGIKIKQEPQKHTIISKRDVMVDWAEVTTQFQEALRKAARIKIGSRYKVDTNYGETFEGRLVYLRGGVFGFSDDGNYKAARVDKCKLTLILE